MDALAHHLLHHQDVPIVFPAAITHWQAAKWTPENLNQIFSDQKLSFRIGRKDSEEVQWEAQCSFRNASVDDFFEWQSGNPAEENPLTGLSVDHHWCYCDYKHMPELFGDKPDIMKAIDWSPFGFLGRGGEKSTFWLGSSGAHTQCHYDTYGCNLVAQIYGRKRWFLFPPSQTFFMYATRVPYEESSVFSKVNVSFPDTETFPKFKLTSPTVVILEPGDVLYVPRHWWHDVTSLSTSISINSWIELQADDNERVREAVTRCIVMGMMANTPNIPDDHWINPTEDRTNQELNLEYLKKTLLQDSIKVCGDKTCLENADDSFVGKDAKRQKTGQDEFGTNLCGCAQRFERYIFGKNIRHLTTYSFEKYIELFKLENKRYISSVLTHELSQERTDQGGLGPRTFQVEAAGTSPANMEKRVGEWEKSSREVESARLGEARSSGLAVDKSLLSEESKLERGIKSGLKVPVAEDQLPQIVPLEKRVISRDELHLGLVECLTHPTVIGKALQLLKEKFQ